MENTKGGLGAAQPYTRTPHGRALYKDPDTGKRKQNPDKLNPLSFGCDFFPPPKRSFFDINIVLNMTTVIYETQAKRSNCSKEHPNSGLKQTSSISLRFLKSYDFPK